MKVIFKKTNEIKEVALGYAVNYLIPRGLAVKATPEAVQKIETQKVEAQKSREKEKEDNRQLLSVFSGKEFIIKARAGKNGKLYGTITKKEIARKLGIQKNFINLKDSIKKTGDYLVELKLNGDRVKVKLRIEADKNAK